MSQWVKVHIMHTGRLKYDRALAFRELDTVPAVNVRGADYQESVPISSYLIEHPEGNVVIDTGWHEAIRHDPQAHLGEDIADFIEYDLPEGWSIREQLAARTITPAKIDLVIATHLDVDHISGIQLLEGAQRFLVSKPEWEHHSREKELWTGNILFETFTPVSIPYGPLGKGLDLFGDGLVYLVHTPGHTAGHLSVLARVHAGWLLLASDAGYAERSWQKLLLPGYTYDDDLARQSLLWVREFSQRPDCVAAIANHDPLHRPRIY